VVIRRVRDLFFGKKVVRTFRKLPIIRERGLFFGRNNTAQNWIEMTEVTKQERSLDGATRYS
jgi:hypothetical protein